MSPRFNTNTSHIYESDYTARQVAILNDDVPIDEIRTTEVYVIMQKAKKRADDISYEIAKCLYDQKKHPCEYFPHYTMEEAKAILEALTPWKIQWNNEFQSY